jgi:hypothetical protein
MLDGEAISNASVKIPLKTLNRHGLIAGDSENGKNHSKCIERLFLLD